MAPITLLTVDSGRIIFNKDELLRLKTRKDLQNLKVVVVSLAGRSHQGKRLILNFMIRYLRHKSENKQGDWLRDCEKLEGFSMSHFLYRGAGRVIIWDEIFKVRTSTNEEVAVVLMNTQGLFEAGSALHGTLSMLAFSTFCSSVQIYNLVQNVTADDLAYLQLCVDFGRLVVNESGIEGPGFQDLLVLVRDWQHSQTMRFGLTGGDMLLEKVLSAQENNDIETNIEGSFGSLCCFLMPHPGPRVASDHFLGDISDIEPTFMEYVCDLVEVVLAPAELTLKVINKKEITFARFCSYVRDFAMAMPQSADMSIPPNIYKAVTENRIRTVRLEMLRIYINAMRQYVRSPYDFLPWSNFKLRHLQCVDSAKEYFISACKLGPDRLWQSVYENTLRDLDHVFNDFERENQVAELLKNLRENQQRESQLHDRLDREQTRSSSIHDELREQLERRIAELEKQIETPAEDHRGGCLIL